MKRILNFAFIAMLVTGCIPAMGIVAPYYWFKHSVLKRPYHHMEGSFLTYMLGMTFGVCIYFVGLPLLVYWLFTHRIDLTVSPR